MPGGIFFVSCVVIMLFIFIESRITGYKRSYGHYIKYGLFVGIMNVVIFYISNGEIPKFPSMNVSSLGPGLPESF